MLNLLAVTFQLPSMADMLAEISTTSVPLFNEYTIFIYFVVGFSAVITIILIIVNYFDDKAWELRKKDLLEKGELHHK